MSLRTSQTHIYSEVIFSWLKIKGMYAPIEWVQACMTWLCEEHSHKLFSLTEWENMVQEQWYFADLRELCTPSIPDIMIESPRYHYVGKPLILQVMWARNITECYYGQIRKLDGTVNANALVSAEDDFAVNVSSLLPMNPQPSSSSSTNSRSNRMLFMELTDGVKYVKAMEHYPIPHIDLQKLVPGVKVSISGEVLCRRGVLMLISSNIDILGGEVENLSQVNQTRNILRQSLAENINLNVNSNNLPHWYSTRGNNAQLNNLSNSSSSNAPSTIPSTITQSRTSASVGSSETQNIRGPATYGEVSPLSTRTTEYNIGLPNGKNSTFRYVDLSPDNSQDLSCIDCDDNNDDDEEEEQDDDDDNNDNGNDLVWSSDEEEEEVIDPAILYPTDNNIIHSTPVRGTKRHYDMRGDNHESSITTRDNPPPPVKVMNQKRQPTNNDILFDELDDELFSQVVSDIENRAPATFSSYSAAKSSTSSSSSSAAAAAVVSDIENRAPATFSSYSAAKSSTSSSSSAAAAAVANQPCTSSSCYQYKPIAASSSDYPFCYIIDLVKKIFLPNFKEGQWIIRGFVSAVISVLEISTTKPYEWQFKVRICDGSGFLDCKLTNHLITTWMKISAEDAFQLRDQPNGQSILDMHLQDFKRKLSLMSGLFTVSVKNNEIPVIRDFRTPDKSTIDALTNRLCTK